MSSHLHEWFGPKPHPTFEHPTLGSFLAEEGVWTSHIPEGAGTLELSLAGNDTSPFGSLVSAASGLLARLQEVKGAALDYLMSQDEAPSREDFICQGIELLREDGPNHFSVSFILFGDLGGIWRVDFEDGEPIFLTRDD